VFAIGQVVYVQGFVAYLRSVMMASNKKIFDITQIDLDDFARWTTLISSVYVIQMLGYRDWVKVVVYHYTFNDFVVFYYCCLVAGTTSNKLQLFRKDSSKNCGTEFNLWWLWKI